MLLASRCSLLASEWQRVARSEQLVAILLPRLLMHVPGDGLDVLDRSRGQDAVSEIEDVAGSPGRPLEHLVGLREDAIDWPEQNRRIEVALHRAIEPDPFPRLTERPAPVGPDDVAAGLTDLRQDGAGPDAEMNRRHAERRDAREDSPGMRQDELAIVLRVQHADPRVEDLHRVDTRLD